MLTRKQITHELKRNGYTGPVSLSRDELLACLQKQKDEESAPRRVGKLHKLPAMENLTPDLEFRVRGEPGWFRFLAIVTNIRTGEVWVDAYGGTNKCFMMRAFRPERIRRDPAGAIKTRAYRRAIKEQAVA